MEYIERSTQMLAEIGNPDSSDVDADKDQGGATCD